MQRETINPTPDATEVLKFSAAEADLAVRALLSHLEQTLHFSDTAIDSRGLLALGAHDVTTVAERIASTHTIAASHATLAEKFAGNVAQPETPVELTFDELLLLGNSLYSLGTFPSWVHIGS